MVVANREAAPRVCTSVLFINPRRACAARVTVLCLFVCLSVCLSVTTLQASVVDRTLKFRFQRSADDTLECFDSWILITMLTSRDTANFVSQEAYERASLKLTVRARDQVSSTSRALAVRDQTRALFSELDSFVYQSVFGLVVSSV